MKKALALASLGLGFTLACSGSNPPSGPAMRAPGERSPLTAPCGDSDEPRCMLPFPSSAFLQTDSTTATGLRVAVGNDAPPNTDDPAAINRADGFSRLSPILTGFSNHLDPTTLVPGAIRLFDAEPGPSYGEEQLLGMRLVNGVKSGSNEAIVIATPKRPLEAASEYLAVVMDSVRAADGSSFTQSRTAQVALGLVAASGDAEERVFAHYAPARELLTANGVDLAHVLRIWDFTTRSLLDPTLRLTAMRAISIAAAKSGSIGVAIDSTGGADANIATVVEGRLTGAPDFLTDEGAGGHLVYGADGTPQPQGVHDVNFRVVLPRATRDFSVVIYGHGTGGDYTDDSFDEGMAQAGLAKIGFDFLGWTGDSILGTVVELLSPIQGSDESTAHLMQAHANIAAIETLLDGALGDALSTALQQALPGSAPVRPNTNSMFYAGGSLGGTMGLVHVAIDRARIKSGLLNVPGTGWTQFIPLSIITDYVRPAWPVPEGGDVDIELQIGSSQTAWDDVDGANWIDAIPGAMPPCLLQESIGDPVLPNIGNELVAQSLHAIQVGVPLRVLPGLAHSTEAIAATGLTQFKAVCASDDPYCVHGFAADNGDPAGVAAQQQIATFLVSSLLGIPRVEVPQDCIEEVIDGSCDFTVGQ